jgi:apolipoprotein N-acyltransferase
VTLGGLAESVIVAWGWRRRLIAVGAGAAGALAMPPFGFLPALVLSLVLAVWLLDGASERTRWATTRQAFALGWWFGFGYFLAGLWWLGAAFLVEADRFAWALPLGVVALPAGLALFHGLAFALARQLWSVGPWRIAAFVAALSCTEWLRGHVLTGFPWNIYGMALGQHLWTAQIASIIGLYGLTVLTLAICAAPASLGSTGPGRWRPTAWAAIALVLITAFGIWRVPSSPVETVAGVRLRLMQPNLPQDAKFRPENRDAIMRHYLALSDRATSPRATGIADVTHLIWPESAFPFLLARDATALAQIAALLPPGATLITGAARAVEPMPGETSSRFRNSIHVLDDQGVIRATYDKVHLVPFGEYLPFADHLIALGLRQFVAIPGGFEAADRRRPLEVPGLPRIAATICYEAIFPGEIVPDGATFGAQGSLDQRPGLILNVTNDAWFGHTPGPYQHLAQARLRAIEEGLPLIRSANSGITAVIDPYGRQIGQLQLGVEGVLDTPLPVMLESTPWAKFGDVFFIILVVMLLAGAGLAVARR